MSSSLVKASTEIANRDIEPSADFARVYPALEPLILNAQISVPFAMHEAAAKRWKRNYQALGISALVCILLAMTAFDYQVTLQDLYGKLVALGPLSAVLATVGLVAQLVLIFSRAKDKWLLHRFVAERLRCLKFQAFMLLADVPGATALKTKVESWIREQLAQLDQEIMGGRAAITEFAPYEAFKIAPHAALQQNRELLRDASKVYDSLRLSVQAQHFIERQRASESGAKVPALLGEFLFGVGAFLAFIEVALTSWATLSTEPNSLFSPHIQAWLSFVTLWMFVISAVTAVYERGTGSQPDAERYQAYSREVRRIRALHANGDVESFLTTVAEMEGVALRELHDFCRDVKHSNFIF